MFEVVIASGGSVGDDECECRRLSIEQKGILVTRPETERRCEARLSECSWCPTSSRLACLLPRPQDGRREILALEDEIGYLGVLKAPAAT